MTVSSTESRAGRFVLPGAILATILPIWVAVIRYGAKGLYPDADAASTVTRARDLFSAHPPLAGMVAAAATQSGYEAHFPGAWQLYVIAVPTRFLGEVWGPLVAMAALNSTWVILAAWLLSRRLPLPQALTGILGLAVLLWSLGSGFVVTPVPVDMVMIPFALFVIAVWSVADGDLTALPVLAVVANYLWLDHLVLVLTVPVIGACAVIGLWLWARRDRREAPAPEHAREMRRLRRQLLVAGVITVVMWIPTLIQQFTNQPGNLRVLFASAGVDRPSVGSWADATHMVISVVGRPSFWLRGTLDSPPYLQPPLGPHISGAFTLFDLLLGLVMVGAFVTLGVLARRRGDRTILTLYGVVVVAFTVSVITTRMAPSYFGVPSGYLRSLWPLSMLVWLAVVLGAMRTIRVHRRATAVVGPVVAAIGIFALLNVPTSSFGYGTDDRSARLVNGMRKSVVPRVRDRGQVMVIPGQGFDSHHYAAPLMLALASEGVDYCAHRRFTLNYGGPPHCGSSPAFAVDVRMVADPDKYRKGRVLYEEPYLTAAERNELAGLDRRIGSWLAGRERLVLTPDARRRLAEVGSNEDFDSIRRKLAQPDRELTADPEFRTLVQLWYGSKDPAGALFSDDPLSGEQWERWTRLRAEDKTLIVTREPLS